MCVALRAGEWLISLEVADRRAFSCTTAKPAGGGLISPSRQSALCCFATFQVLNHFLDAGYFVLKSLLELLKVLDPLLAGVENVGRRMVRRT